MGRGLRHTSPLPRRPRRVRGILANRVTPASDLKPGAGLRSILLFKGIVCLTASSATGNVAGFRVLPRNMAMELTGAEIVVRCLQEEGVEHVFGYPGGAVLFIYDELFKQNKVKHILVRHEQGAVHAADGYARASGRPGVCSSRAVSSSK